MRMPPRLPSQGATRVSAHTAAERAPRATCPLEDAVRRPPGARSGGGAGGRAGDAGQPVSVGVPPSALAWPTLVQVTGVTLRMDSLLNAFWERSYSRRDPQWHRVQKTSQKLSAETT